MDQQLTYQQLQALLEDTQASLAASFARIEAYRLQNRQLRDELAALRSAVHGAAGTEEAEAGPLSSISIKFPQMASAPSAQHSVTIIDGPSGRRAPGCLLIGRDFIEFNEPR